MEGGGSRFGNGSRPQATCMSRILRCIMRCMLKPFAITAPSSETTHRTRRDIYPPIKTGAPTTSLYLCAPIPVHVPLPRLTSAVSLPLPAVSHDADSYRRACSAPHFVSRPLPARTAATRSRTQASPRGHSASSPVGSPAISVGGSGRGLPAATVPALNLLSHARIPPAAPRRGRADRYRAAAAATAATAAAARRQ